MMGSGELRSWLLGEPVSCGTVSGSERNKPRVKLDAVFEEGTSLASYFISEVAVDAGKLYIRSEPG